MRPELQKSRIQRPQNAAGFPITPFAQIIAWACILMLIPSAHASTTIVPFRSDQPPQIDGQLNDAVNMKLQTDGLWMSLDTKTTSTSGDIKLKCKGGFGMSMRPQGETGGGRMLDGERVMTEVTKVTDVNTLDFAKYIRQGGMSVAGTHKLKVQLICAGQ